MRSQLRCFNIVLWYKLFIENTVAESSEQNTLTVDTSPIILVSPAWKTGECRTIPGKKPPRGYFNFRRASAICLYSVFIINGIFTSHEEYGLSWSMNDEADSAIRKIVLFRTMCFLKIHGSEKGKIGPRSQKLLVHFKLKTTIKLSKPFSNFRTSCIEGRYY